MFKTVNRATASVLLGAVLMASASAQVQPLGDAFMYQCRLDAEGAPVNAFAEFRFSLWDAASGGTQVGPTILAADDIVDGLFTGTLDFGPGSLNGQARWIEVEVQSPPGAGFVTLTPRQRVRPTPYAQVAGRALNAWALGGNLDTDPSQHFLGTADQRSLAFRVNNEPTLRLEYGEASVFGAFVLGNLVGGHPLNAVTQGQGNAIGGGGGSTRPNAIRGSVGVIGGGLGNEIGTDTTDADYATVGGGFLNAAEATGATVSGGGANSAGGQNSVVAGGSQNDALGPQSVIGGGTQNMTTGRFATVPGGANNVAAGDFSLAGGFFAEALHDGSFVWSDKVDPADTGFASTAEQQFLIRARGGVGIGTNTPVSELEVNGTVTATSFAGDGSKLSGLAGSTVDVEALAMLRWDLLNRDFPTMSAYPVKILFDGTSIWAGGLQGITRLSAVDGTNLGDFAIPCREMAFDGTHVWVAGLWSNEVTKLRASDGANLGTFTSVTSPVDVVFDGSDIWVLSFEGALVKLRISDGAVLETVPLGPAQKYAMAFDGQNIWVTLGGGQVAVVRVSDATVINTYSSVPINDIIFDGTHMWFCEGAFGQVAKLRASDGVNVGTYTVNSANLMTYDGSNIWISTGTGNVLQKLRASDGVLQDTIVLPNLPGGLAFDGSNMWIGVGNGTVQRMTLAK